MDVKNILILMNFGTKLINCLFEEYQTAVHERRRGTYHYLTFAIIIKELIEQVKQRKVDITTPSEE